MNAVTDTSREAYWSLVAERKLQPMEEKILVLLSDNIARTRKEIRDKTGLELASVCGRVNSLLAAGLVKIVGEKRDSKTGKWQEMIELIKYPSLFD